MRKYDDLIYYKQDLIDEYSAKRKNLESKDVEDLLRCALLFLEKEVKKPNFSSFEIPNIGFLHKKISVDRSKKPTKRVLEVDNIIAECAYLDTTYLPILMREDMVERFYPEHSLEDLQKIQNDK